MEKLRDFRNILDLRTEVDSLTDLFMIDPLKPMDTFWELQNAVDLNVIESKIGKA